MPRKMSQIVFILFALAFVQIVRSQTLQCRDAVEALLDNDQCVFRQNPSAVCTGSCGILATTVLDDCESSHVS